MEETIKRPRTRDESQPRRTARVEKTVRKLLVASQKSGVGKTTTSINLAAATAIAGARVLLVEADPLSAISAALNLPQHPDKRQLRAAGIDLPGVLFCGVIPGLDVFSPYEEGGCSDEDFDRVLQLLSLDAFRESYDCLIVNGPPFLGGRPAELLASCDEFVVVMQAEPLAHRTMPAFLEMVQRSSQGAGRAATMRGVVLTLPESEAPGGRWERELRGRFGKSVLPSVVPYDEEVGKASLFGHVVAHASPEAPASVAYQEMAGELQLAKGASGAKRPADAALSLAAAAVRANPLVARSAPRPAVKAGGRRSSTRVPRPSASGASLPQKDSPAPPPAAPPPEHVPSSPDRPSRAEGSRRATQPAPVAAAPAPAPAPGLARPVPMPLHSVQRPWFVWVGFAIVAGIGLRFVHLPDFALPMIVGLAVTAAVTLVLHLFLNQAGQEPASHLAAQPAGSTSGLHATASSSSRRK
jgi:chromosome partitioning protein